jgi:hypothetical protein
MAAAPVPPAAVPVPTPEAAPLSEGARLINTFIAPSKTFTDLRRNASWWAPWIAISIFSLLFIYAIDRQIGFDQISRTEIARTPQRAEQIEKLPPDQQAKQMAIAVAFTKYISYATPFVVLIIYLIIAAVLMATFNFGAGAEVSFKTSLAIVLYGSLPGIVAAVLGVISLFAGVDPEGFNIRNAVATNPAYFMDPMGSKFVYGVASAFDVISIWSIVLMGIGFSCTSKVKRSTAITIVAVWFLVYKLVSASLAAAFS